MTFPKRLQDQLDRLEPQFRDAFIASVRDVSSAAQLSAIAGHLEAGNIAAAVAALNLSPGFFAPLDDTIRAAYLTGGRDALSSLPAIASPFPVAAWLSALTEGTQGPKRG